MRRFFGLTAALALGLACALLISSCGGSSGGTLPADRAAEINTFLDQIEERAAAGDCEGAGSLSQELAQTIQARNDIDDKLRNALVDGLERIQALSTDSSFCSSGETTTETTTTQETTTEETTTEETTPTVTTPTQETTPTQPTTPTTPTGGGGTGGVGGGSGGIGTP